MYYVDILLLVQLSCSTTRVPICMPQVKDLLMPTEKVEILMSEWRSRQRRKGGGIVPLCLHCSQPLLR